MKRVVAAVGPRHGASAPEAGFGQVLRWKLLRRNERRNKISAAFDRFRDSVAAALGAAEHEYAQARLAREKELFHLAVMRAGVAQARRDPDVAAKMDDPEFAAIMTAEESERAEIFAPWTDDGPAELDELVSAAAPGAAGEPWREWLGSAGKADARSTVPGLWRIGTAVARSSPDERPFPAAVPLLDESHLYLTSTRDTRESAEALVENILLRVLSYFQPGMVRVHVWDVAQLTGTLAGLYPLTRAGLLTAHDPAQADDMLEELSDHIRRIHTSALVGGHTSLRALSEETGSRSEPWRIVVLFGNGEPLKDEQRQQLQRIARNGLDCGMQLIVVDLPLTINSAVESVALSEPGVARCSTTGPHATVELDPALPREHVTRACSVIAETQLSKRNRARSFQDLLPDRQWTHDSVSGLRAPVGFSDGEPAWISLGDAAPHALIGGPSGSGKTNFLYAMLGSLADRYGPDELELYLLDFKEGVSFAQFTPGRRDPSWLPHAQLVGVNVNADREFGLALLRFLAAELRRRADAAKEHEVTKLEELRAEDPHGRWPRIVAVIDEFQYLFAERDAVSNQATTLLEDVARRGRSQGIHLVLASQDVSGIEAFWGKPAIFEQFIVRIALPKARRALADQNNAAMELPRWHAVLNHESGVRHGNEVVRVPDATSKGTFDVLQERLWQQRPEEDTAPRLFDGSHLPKLAELRDFRNLDTGTRTPRTLLGQVIDVEGTAAAVDLARTPGRNIAVIGTVLVDATSVLTSAVLSLARQHPPGQARFTIAELVEESSGAVEHQAALLRALGHQVEVVGLGDLPGALSGLTASLAARADGSETALPHYLVPHAVDAAHSLLEQKDPQTRASGADDLRQILKQGPENRVHVIGWWRSAQRLKTSLGMGPVDDVGAWVAFDVHGQELSQYAAGQVVNWSPRPRRGLFFDRSTHSRPEVILPFDVDGTTGEEVR